MSLQELDHEDRDEPHYLLDSEIKFMDYVGAFVHAKPVNHYSLLNTKLPKYDELGYDFHDYVPREEDLNALRERGYLHTETITRRKIRWAPTKEGFELIQRLWSPAAPYEYFPRDPNGSLTHRKAVFGGCFKTEESATEFDRRILHSSQHKGNLDYRMEVEDLNYDICIEAVTMNNDTERLNKKYQKFQSENMEVGWVFPNRTTAVRLLSRVSDRDNDLHLDLNVSEPAQYPIDKLNTKLWNLHDRGYAAGISFVQTIMGTINLTPKEWGLHYDGKYNNSE